MIDHLLNITAKVERATEEKDAIGSIKKTWKAISYIKCRIEKKSGKEIVSNEKSTHHSTHTLYSTAGADITNLDRVVIGSETYKVVDGDNPHGLNNHKEVDLLLEK